jgi:hypothetical protein
VPAETQLLRRGLTGARPAHDLGLAPLHLIGGFCRLRASSTASTATTSTAATAIAAAARMTAGSPITSARQPRLASGSASVAATISGPMPLGSPIVIATRGAGCGA